MSRKFIFTDDNGEQYPEWEQKKLGEIALNKPQKYDPFKSKDEYCSVELENLDGGGSGTINGWFSSLEQKSTKNMFKTGDILLGKLRPYLKKWARPNFDGVCSTEIWVLTGLNESISNEFLYVIVQSPDVQQNLIDITSGTKMPRADWKAIAATAIALPSLPEQQKIAEFFGALDERIALTADRVRLLKEQKKGYLQQVFNRELVFTDDNGNHYPEWEQKKVQDIFKITRGQVIAKPSLSNAHTIATPYPVYSSQTTNNGILGWSDCYDFEGQYITWTTDGANAGRVFSRTGKFRCTNVCGVLVEKEETVGFANSSLAAFLNIAAYKHVMRGVGNPKLMNDVMGKVVIPVPSLPEQEKIAGFFSALDERIELTENKLALLKEQKKGYLQGIFG